MNLKVFVSYNCEPCLEFLTTLDLLGVAYEVVDLVENPEEGLKYDIRGVPTIIGENDSKEIGRKVGSLSEINLNNWLKKINEIKQ